MQKGKGGFRMTYVLEPNVLIFDNKENAEEFASKFQSIGLTVKPRKLDD